MTFPIKQSSKQNFLNWWRALFIFPCQDVFSILVASKAAWAVMNDSILMQIILTWLSEACRFLSLPRQRYYPAPAQNESLLCSIGQRISSKDYVVWSAARGQNLPSLACMSPTDKHHSSSLHLACRQDFMSEKLRGWTALKEVVISPLVNYVFLCTSYSSQREED
jgi:hypothetical protein